MSYQKLFIMRHGKSDWATLESSDAERPLNERGRRDVAKMAVWLRNSEFSPTCIKSSTARRATETAQIVAEELNGLQIIFEESLYLADLNELIEVVAQPPVSSWMLIGHNPGLESLLHFLDPEIENRIEFSKIMPTAAIYAFEIDMSDLVLSMGSGQLLYHQRPKRLD